MKTGHVVLVAVSVIFVIIIVMAVLLIMSLPAYAKYWKQQNTQPIPKDALVYVALGDSAAQGIGASSPARGYVGLIADQLHKDTGRTVHVINLSKSGARINDVLQDQLPLADDIKPDVVTIEIGANDIADYNELKFKQEFTKLIAALPAKSYVANLPYFGGRTQLPFLGFGKPEKDVQAANVVIAEITNGSDVIPVDLHAETKQHNRYPWDYAIDYFHPNNLGYHAWANAFLQQIKR